METVGSMLVDDMLPADMRQPGRVLDKKGINDLLGEIARRYPERYREISKGLSDLGKQASQDSGGFSFGMQHLSKSPAATTIQTQIRGRVQQLLDDDSITDDDREHRIVKLLSEQLKPQQDAVFAESLKSKNPLAYQVMSGSRGNKVNLSGLRGSDLLYVDHRDNPIPVPVFSSYSEGLKPAEYWGASYGARKGLVDVKTGVRSAGYFSKQLNQITHRLVVEDLDTDSDDKTVRGMPVDSDDPDSAGALLAKTVGPYSRNTVLTPKILAHLSQLGQKRILVRSPIVGGSPGGGVYARDVGVREYGNLPGRGEIPGLTAAQALAEPLAQGGLNSKHTGGISGEAKAVSGFDWINQLVQVPKHFEGGATHSEDDGVVGKIIDAPAGGKYVYVNGKEHYVPTDSPVTVKTGEQVEAGDVLSEGLPNPAKVVAHKGIGEGRRYFVKAFRQAMTDAGVKSNRRNIELLSRGLIDHVRLTDEMGNYAPDDVVPYHEIEHNYQPRPEAREVPINAAGGHYLEKPVLHYTIGTRVRPSVAKDLKEFGVSSVTVHDKPPPFVPEMIRGAQTLAYDPDWMTRMYGSGLQRSLLRGVHRGAISDEKGTSFVPSLAKAVDFGRSGAVHNPEPGWEVKAAEVPVARYVKVRVSDKDKILHHYYIGAGRFDLPAGRVETGESDAEAAKRELLDRTGYSIPASKLSYSGKITDADGQDFSLFDGDFAHAVRATTPVKLGGVPTTLRWVKAADASAGVSEPGSGVPGKPGQTGTMPSVPKLPPPKPPEMPSTPSASTPSTASTPPTASTPSNLTPDPKSLWYGGAPAAPSGGSEMMMRAALPMVQNMGPAGPMALIGSLDWNALGTLTGGKDWSQQAQYTQQLNNPQSLAQFAQPTASTASTASNLTPGGQPDPQSQAPVNPADQRLLQDYHGKVFGTAGGQYLPQIQNDPQAVQRLGEVWQAHRQDPTHYNDAWVRSQFDQVYNQHVSQYGSPQLGESTSGGYPAALQFGPNAASSSLPTALLNRYQQLSAAGTVPAAIGERLGGQLPGVAADVVGGGMRDVSTFLNPIDKFRNFTGLGRGAGGALGAGIGIQTVIDSFKDVADAWRDGGFGPGIARRMSPNVGAPPPNWNSPVQLTFQNANARPENVAAFVGNAQADSHYLQDVGNNILTVHGLAPWGKPFDTPNSEDIDLDPARMSATANRDMPRDGSPQSFKWDIRPDGAQYLDYTGDRFNRSFQADPGSMFSSDPNVGIPPEHRMEVLTRLARERPDMFRNLTDNPVYAAYVNAGQAPSASEVEENDPSWKPPGPTQYPSYGDVHRGESWTPAPADTESESQNVAAKLYDPASFQTVEDR